MKMITLLIAFFFFSTPLLAQENGFYLAAKMGTQPHTKLITENPELENPTESGSIMLGIAPTYKINNSFDVSIFYVFEGHTKPIPVTSSFGLEGLYLLASQAKSPFVALGLGKGTNGDIGNGSDGLFLNPSLGYQFESRSGKWTRASLEYSIQKANDFDYSKRNSNMYTKTDATTKSIKAVATITIFRSKRFKQ